jgi:iron complex transport system substrate-binding protein
VIRRLPATLAAAWLVLAFTAPGQAAAGDTTAGAADLLPAPLPAGARLIAVGAALTDTVCALGAGDRLLATDDGGHDLPEASHLPSVGYARTLSTEGLLALRPDALLVGSEAGPASVLDQIRAAGPRVVVLPLEASEEGACVRLRAVARLLGRDEQGERLVADLQRDLASLRAALAQRAGPPPRVMFLYARSSTSVHAAGHDTPAEAMLRLAGANNALADVDGYTLLTPEAAVSAAPDAIVLPARSLELMGGVDALSAHPGLALTPAVKAGRVIALDDLLLLGFGPRTGSAARLLASQLDPRLPLSGTTPTKVALPARDATAR